MVEQCMDGDSKPSFLEGVKPSALVPKLLFDSSWSLEVGDTSWFTVDPVSIPPGINHPSTISPPQGELVQGCIYEGVNGPSI